MRSPILLVVVYEMRAFGGDCQVARGTVRVAMKIIEKHFSKRVHGPNHQNRQVIWINAYKFSCNQSLIVY